MPPEMVVHHGPKSSFSDSYLGDEAAPFSDLLEPVAVVTLCPS